MLEISLLGRFDIRLDGQVVDLPSRPAQSLFAYLVMRAGTAHRREKLAGMFWPEATEANARAYLRQALWRIRKALDPGSDASKPLAEFVTADELTVAFDGGQRYRLDVAELEREGTGHASTDDLVRAVSVYQGELLPGFYSEWIDLERERLQAVFESKLSKLLEGLVAERRWPATLEWGERWIALGHVPEPAYRALMQAHHGLGDRSSMAAAYQRCKEALQRELGVEPSESTRALYVRFSRSEAPPERATSDRIRVASLVERKRLFASAPQGGLPRQLTSFIGREREAAEVKRLFEASLSRLVTLTGVGGCGKTRLALHVSQQLPQYPQTVWFVELASLTDPARVPQTVAATLGLLEDPDRPILTTLTEYLSGKNAVLILDNCEHLVEACAQMCEALLRVCPDLHILTTSREALGVTGETGFQVPSLSVPQGQRSLTMEEALQYEAVCLFVDRAKAAQPGFSLTRDNVAAVAQICYRLDGIPLAVELAAARVKMLTPEQIATRLSDRFRLLTGGSRTALPRQQTLRATLDWSYNLLSQVERDVLCDLSAFAGGWTLEAAEEVCGRADAASPPLDVLDLLTQLVNKSLVVTEQTPGGPARYRLLETIRHYAREKLMEAGEGAAVRDRHLKHFLALAERAEAELTGPKQVEWLNRLETELDNVRAALDWALESEVGAGLRLATSLRRFWDAHDHSREGADWLSRLLEQPQAQQYSRARARALGAQAALLISQWNLDQARAAAETSLALSRGEADQPGEAYALGTLGVLDCLRGDMALATPLLEESLRLFRAAGDKVNSGEVLAWLSLDHRDARRARTYLEEGLAASREAGHVAGIANSLIELAQQACWDGDCIEPMPWLDEAMSLYRQLGSKSGLAWALQVYGTLAFHLGDYERARTCFEESLALSEAAGLRDLWPAAHLAYVAARQGRVTQARAMFREIIQRFAEERISVGVAYSVEGLANLAVAENELGRAARLLGWADATREAIGDFRPPVEQMAVDGDLGVIRSQLDQTAFATAHAEGQSLTMEQIIAYADEVRPC